MLARRVWMLGVLLLGPTSLARAQATAPPSAPPASAPPLLDSASPPRPRPGRPPLVPARPSLVPSSLARGAVLAALRACRYPEKRAELASLASRARTAAVLPEVWLRASRSTDQSLRLSPTVDDPSRYSEAGGAGVWLEARLIWHLDRLVYDRDELSVVRLEADHAEAAGRLSRRVLELLFAWQRAAARESDANASPEEREGAFLAKAEAEVALDVLTAGWFGAENRRIYRD